MQTRTPRRTANGSMLICGRVFINIYIYIYMCIYIHIYVCVYIYTLAESDSPKEKRQWRNDRCPFGFPLKATYVFACVFLEKVSMFWWLKRREIKRNTMIAPFWRGRIPKATCPFFLKTRGTRNWGIVPFCFFYKGHKGVSQKEGPPIFLNQGNLPN